MFLIICVMCFSFFWLEVISVWYFLLLCGWCRVIWLWFISELMGVWILWVRLVENCCRCWQLLFRCLSMVLNDCVICCNLVGVVVMLRWVFRLVGWIFVVFVVSVCSGCRLWCRISQLSRVVLRNVSSMVVMIWLWYWVSICVLFSSRCVVVICNGLWLLIRILVVSMCIGMLLWVSVVCMMDGFNVWLVVIICSDGRCLWCGLIVMIGVLLG